MILNLSAENQILLAFSKFELSMDDKAFIEKNLLLISDWNEFYVHAILLGIGSLIPSSCQKIEVNDFIPVEVLIRFNTIYHRSLVRNILLYEQFHEILHAFSINGIPIIPLKGIYLAESFYNDIGLRQMSDIDLLVKEKDSVKCLQILNEMGFVANGRYKTDFIKNQSGTKHLPTMVRKDVLVEIHFRVPIDNTVNTIDIEDYWKTAKPFTLNNTHTLALSPEYLLQYLCIHLERHFNEGKIQLYQFTDLLILLQKHYQTINWELFEKSCFINNCDKNVSRILFLLHNFFSVTFPENISQSFNLKNDKDTADLFIHYLNCDKKSIQRTIGIQNLRNLKKVKGFGNKIQYVFHDLFPSRTFMYQRYQIKHKNFVFFYYLKRLTKGLILLIRAGSK